MKKKVKRYAGQDKSLVEIEERSIKTPRLIEEEKAKAPMDYAGLGGRARATSPFAGPKEYITESKETEVESEAPKGIAAGFDAKRYLEESESKGGGPRSETKPAVEKKKKVAPKRVSQSFGVDEAGMAERSKAAMSSEKEPTGRFYKPVKGTVESMGRRYSESNPFAKRMAGGGKVSSASKRADGIAQRGKTKGRIC